VEKYCETSSIKVGKFLWEFSTLRNEKEKLEKNCNEGKSFATKKLNKKCLC
jgi:hypothetical protein